MKKKNNKNTDVKQPIVLIGTQNKRKTNLIIALIVKLLLTYVLSAGTIMCFTDFYNINYELSLLIQQVPLYVTAFFPVFLIIKKRYLIPTVLVLCVILYGFLHETLNEALLIFKDHILISLNSRLLHTLQLVPQDSVAFLTKTQDYISGMNTSMLLVSGAICFLSVIFTHKRFMEFATIAMWTVLYAPAFVAEKAEYNPYLLLIIPAFFGLYAISSSNFIEEESLITQSSKKSKTMQKSTPIESATQELSKHGKNCLCGILAGLIAFSTFLATQSRFPNMSSLDIEDTVKSITAFFSEISDYFGSAFSGGQQFQFNNYFSSGNFFISNDIELKAPPATSENKVLKISSSSPNPFYLIGDVGVDFTGNSWISVMKKEKNGGLSYNGYTISETFDPNILYQLYLSYVIANGSIDSNVYDGFVTFSSIDDRFASQYLSSYYNYETSLSFYNVVNNISNYSYLNIEYLQNTDIVFKPFIPGNTSYMSNENFSVYADSIIRISDKKNWMKNFETDIILPYYSLWFASVTSKSLSDFNSLLPPSLQSHTSLGFNTDEQLNSFLREKEEYDRYIKSNYLSVPDSEKENMRRFLNQFEASYDISPSSLSSDYLYAFTLCEYLKQNYKYSLTENNTANSQNTLLGNFLFNTKKGHCALYASAMTLALREHGIPARYVSGFSTGELTLNETTGYYEKTLTEKNLHAWVEVYFPECGWLAFDPTGQSDTAQPSTPSSSQTVTTPPSTTTIHPPITTPPQSSTITTPPLSQSTGNKGEHSDPGPQSNNGTLLTIIVIAVSVIAIAALIYGFIETVRNKNKARWRRYKKINSNKATKQMHRFIMKLYSITDITPYTSELPTEFAVRVDNHMNIADKKNNLQSIISIIEKAEFSANQISEEERRLVYVYTKMLYNLVLSSSGFLKRIYLKIIL